MKPENLRRSLGELKILYKTHPRLRDVFVEGPSDARFFRWFLQELGVDSEIKVFDIDTRAEIPREKVLDVHSEVNRRGRLFALAYEANSWESSSRGVTCVVDADFDVLQPTNRPDNLLMTDYPALEVYGLQPRPLNKFLAQFGDENIRDGEEVLRVLLPTWGQLFLLRYILHNHSDGDALVSNFPAKVIDKSGKVAVDVMELICASTRQGKEEVERLHELYEQKALVFPPASLATVRGHDVAPLLIKFLALTKELKSVSAVESLLRACIELRDLIDLPLFKALIARVSV